MPLHTACPHYWLMCYQVEQIPAEASEIMHTSIYTCSAHVHTVMLICQCLWGDNWAQKFRAEGKGGHTKRHAPWKNLQLPAPISLLLLAYALDTMSRRIITLHLKYTSFSVTFHLTDYLSNAANSSKYRSMTPMLYFNLIQVVSYLVMKWNELKKHLFCLKVLKEMKKYNLQWHVISHHNN
jgi:hypothetical protein